MPRVFKTFLLGFRKKRDLIFLSFLGYSSTFQFKTYFCWVPFPVFPQNIILENIFYSVIYLFSSILKIMWDSSMWDLCYLSLAHSAIPVHGLLLVKYVRNVLWQHPPPELRHVCEAAHMNESAWIWSWSEPRKQSPGKILIHLSF